MATIPGAYATSPLNPAVSDEDLSGALRSRMMRRMLVRLTPLVLLLLVAPLAAEAQQARIGFLALGHRRAQGTGLTLELPPSTSSGKDSANAGTWKARTSSLSSGERPGSLNGFPSWQPSWSDLGWT